MSATPSIALRSTASAALRSIASTLVWYGISVTTMTVRPLISSI